MSVKKANHEWEDGWYSSQGRPMSATYHHKHCERARLWPVKVLNDGSVMYEGRIWYSVTDDDDSEVFELGRHTTPWSAVEALDKLVKEKIHGK